MKLLRKLLANFTRYTTPHWSGFRPQCLKACLANGDDHIYLPLNVAVSSRGKILASWEILGMIGQYRGMCRLYPVLCSLPHDFHAPAGFHIQMIQGCFYTSGTQEQDPKLKL